MDGKQPIIMVNDHMTTVGINGTRNVASIEKMFLEQTKKGTGRSAELVPLTHLNESKEPEERSSQPSVQGVDPDNYATSKLADNHQQSGTSQYKVR